MSKEQETIVLFSRDLQLIILTSLENEGKKLRYHGKTEENYLVIMGKRME